MAADTLLRLKVQQADPDLGIAVDLGEVTFGPQGELAVISTRPNYKQLLANVVEAVNSQAQLNIKIPPPAGEPPGVYALIVSRAAPNLLEMMDRYLTQAYSLQFEEVES